MSKKKERQKRVKLVTITKVVKGKRKQIKAYRDSKGHFVKKPDFTSQTKNVNKYNQIRHLVKIRCEELGIKTTKELNKKVSEFYKFAKLHNLNIQSVKFSIDEILQQIGLLGEEAKYKYEQSVPFYYVNPHFSFEDFKGIKIILEVNEELNSPNNQPNGLLDYEDFSGSQEDIEAWYKELYHYIRHEFKDDSPPTTFDVVYANKNEIKYKLSLRGYEPPQPATPEEQGEQPPVKEGKEKLTPKETEKERELRAEKELEKEKQKTHEKEIELSKQREKESKQKESESKQRSKEKLIDYAIKSGMKPKELTKFLKENGF